MANISEFKLDGHAPLNRCFDNEDFDKADKAMDYVMNEFCEEKPAALLVKGGPGTRKTTFLCRAALHLSSKSEKVVCLMNNELVNRFKEELAEEKTRQELSEDHGGNIVVVGVRRNQHYFEKRQEEELFRRKTVVIIDMVNYISNGFLKKLFHWNRKSRMIASFDTCFPLTHEALFLLKKYQERNEKLLLLTDSNRSELFLQWPRAYLYNEQINGVDTPNGAYRKYYNCGKEGRCLNAKIVDVVKMLRSKDPEGTIGISLEGINGQAHKVLKDLLAAGITDHNITFASIEKWQFMAQVEHFISVQRTYDDLYERKLNIEHINVTVTRPTTSFHFIANLERWTDNRNLQFRAFFQWVRGLPMDVVLRKTAPESREAPRLLCRHPEPAPVQPSSENRFLRLFPAAAPKAPEAPSQP